MKRCVCLSLVLLGLVYSTGASTQSPTSGLTTSSSTTSTNPMINPEATTAGTTTGKPDNSTSTSQPTSSTLVGSTPTAAGTTTTSPAATNSSEQTTAGSASDTTIKANPTGSTVSSTEPPATPAANTTASAVVTTMTVPSNTSTPTSTAIVTSTPAETTAPTATSTGVAPTTTSAPVATHVVISETNLLLASSGLFVELKGPVNKSLSGLTLVIFNATSATESSRKDFSDTDTFLASGYFMENINATEVQNLQTVMIALYPTKDYNRSSPNRNIEDFVLFSSSNSSAAVDPGFQEAFLPNEKPVTLVESGLSKSQNLTLSRCGPRDAQKNASLFVLATPSVGGNNTCNLMMPNNTMWTLGLYRKSNVCSPDMEDDLQERDRVKNHLVTLINQRCRCGLTTLLVDVVNFTCIRNLYMDFKIKESYEGQTNHVISAFEALADGRVSFMMHGEEYRVLNCTTNCIKYNPSIIPPHGSSTDGTTMTVAVVLSCVCVFLIILVAVILYMRGRRRGIIRQFRMTRLQEDDDMDDMDDFIGGGGEASFSSRHR